MKRFEEVRNDFNGSNSRSDILQLNMKDLEEGDPLCIQYDPDDGEVTLTLSVPYYHARIGRLMQQLAMTCRPVSILS